MRFETKQRMITGASGFSGVVADFGAFDLPAEQGKHGGIEIQNQRGPGFQMKRFLTQLVLQNGQGRYRFGRKALQQIAKDLGFGKSRQAQKFGQGTIVSQNSRIGKTSNAGHGKINQCKQQLAGLEGAVAPDMASAQNACQTILQIELFAKLLKKNQPAKQSLVRFPNDKLYGTQPFSHGRGNHPP